MRTQQMLKGLIHVCFPSKMRCPTKKTTEKTKFNLTGLCVNVLDLFLKPSFFGSFILL